MRFEEVLPALREGKKIRLAHWDKDKCIYTYEEHLLNQHGAICSLGLDTSLYDSWEIVKEPKVVADYAVPFTDVYRHPSGVGAISGYTIQTLEVGKVPKDALKIEGTERTEK